MQVRIGARNFEMLSDDNYLSPQFEPETVRLFDSLVRRRDRTVDVGANVGCTTLALAQVAAHVSAFEPVPSTFEYLAKNVAASGMTNITIANLGLGATRTRAQVTYAPSNRSGGFVSDLTTASEGHRTEQVQIEVLDEVGLGPVDFLKVDVEGFELHVLQGGRNTIANHRPVTLLEMNHWCLNAFQRTSIPEFLEAVMAAFPIVLAVQGETYLDVRDPSERYVVMYRHIVCDMQYLNLVCAHDDERLTLFRSRYRHSAE